MRRHLLLFAPIALFAFGSIGCQPPAAPMKIVPSPAAPAGWTLLKDETAHLSILVPSGWRNGVPLPFPTMPEMGMGEGEGSPVSAMIAEDQRQGQIAGLEKLRGNGIFLHCVDGSKPTIGEQPTRFFVERLDDCPNLRSAVAKERGRMPNENEGVAFETPVGKAWFLESRDKNRIGDEERHVSYLFADGKHAWALRFISTNSPDVFDSFHRDVASTLRKF